jgi:hypothetical protein
MFFRYVFTGAEVYPDSSDDEIDNDDDEDDGRSSPPVDFSDQPDEVETPEPQNPVSEDLE